jgi:hypothetical protein
VWGGLGFTSNGRIRYHVLRPNLVLGSYPNFLVFISRCSQAATTATSQVTTSDGVAFPCTTIPTRRSKTLNLARPRITPCRSPLISSYTDGQCRDRLLPNKHMSRTI